MHKILFTNPTPFVSFIYPIYPFQVVVCFYQQSRNFQCMHSLVACAPMPLSIARYARSEQQPSNTIKEIINREQLNNWERQKNVPNLSRPEKYYSHFWELKGISESVPHKQSTHTHTHTQAHTHTRTHPHKHVSRHPHARTRTPKRKRTHARTQARITIQKYLHAHSYFLWTSSPLQHKVYTFPKGPLRIDTEF